MGVERWPLPPPPPHLLRAAAGRAQDAGLDPSAQPPTPDPLLSASNLGQMNPAPSGPLLSLLPESSAKAPTRPAHQAPTLLWEAVGNTGSRDGLGGLDRHQHPTICKIANKDLLSSLGTSIQYSDGLYEERI